MKLELVAAWSCTPDREALADWLEVAPGSVGVFLADGSLTVRRAAAGAPVLASMKLPASARVALDPRAEVVACLDGASLRLVALAGTQVAEVALPDDLTVQEFRFRADGERLWLFGFVGSDFHALAYDRALGQVGDYRPELTLSPVGWPIQVHPTADAFVLTLSVDQDDPEAGIRRIGVQVENGEPRIMFDEGEIDHPCIGFTNDGRFLIGIDPFTRVMAFPWPTYRCDHEAAFEPEHEGRPVGMIVGEHLVTERHGAAAFVWDPQTQSAQAQEKQDSALWVLSAATASRCASGASASSDACRRAARPCGRRAGGTLSARAASWGARRRRDRSRRSRCGGRARAWRRRRSPSPRSDR